MAESFGSFVDARLRQLGLSMRAYANLAGYRTGHSIISLVLRGKMPPPLKSLDRWAAPLGLTASERSRFDLLAAVANSPKLMQEWFAEHDRPVQGRKRR